MVNFRLAYKSSANTETIQDSSKQQQALHDSFKPLSPTSDKKIDEDFKPVRNQSRRLMWILRRQQFGEGKP